MRGSHALRSLLGASLALAAALTLTHCDLLEEGIDIPITFTHTVSVPVDLGAATGAAAGQAAPQDVTYPLSMGTIPVDLVSSNSQVAANRSKIQKIEFTTINVTPTTNTLTAATPVVEIYVGPAGATQPSQGILIATLPSLPAGAIASAMASIDTQNQTLAQPYLTSLNFTLLPVATLSVQQGQTIPSGAADLSVRIGIKATLNPTK